MKTNPFTNLSTLVTNTMLVYSPCFFSSWRYLPPSSMTNISLGLVPYFYKLMQFIRCTSVSDKEALQSWTAELQHMATMQVHMVTPVQAIATLWCHVRGWETSIAQVKHCLMAQENLNRRTTSDASLYPCHFMYDLKIFVRKKFCDCGAMRDNSPGVHQVDQRRRPSEIS